MEETKKEFIQSAENTENSVDLEDVTQFIRQSRENLVHISEDAMMASVELVEPEEGKEYTLEDVLALLHQNGVKCGIVQENIQQMLLEKRYYEEVEVAYGCLAEDGKNGHFIYHFNTHPRSAPKVMEDGSVDYRNLECFEGVSKDQLIAEYVPETEGTNGYDVKGRELTSKPGRPAPAIRGKHIYMSEDHMRFYSDVDGKIELEPDTGRIRISNVCNINGNVDASTGNIVFKGNVEIMGSVTSGFKVEATGSVVVNGIVEAATIRAGKDVLLRRGMTGNGKGFIVAGGNVEGRFFEQTNIECGGYVHANSIMNCYVDSRDEVVLSGNRGVLLAGRVRALRGVTAVNIGNLAQVPTYIKVGLEPKMRQRFEELRKEMDFLLRDLEKIASTQEALSKVVAADDKKAMVEEKKLLLMRTKITKTTELERLKEESRDLEEQIQAGKHAAVTVDQWAYAGCSVTINGATNNVKEDVRNVIFTLRKGNVIMSYKE